MLRPLTTGELLDRTFALYRKNFLLFAGIAAIPALLVMFIETIPTFIEMFRPVGRADMTVLLVRGGATLLAIGVAYIGFGIAQGATVFGVASAYMGKPVTVADCYRKIRGKIGRLIGITFGTSILIGLASLLLFIPGILLAIKWALVVPVAMLEDASFSVATSRSSDLSTGKGWQIFLIGFLYIVLTYVMLFLAYLPFIILVAVIVALTHNNHPPAWANLVLPITTFFGKLVVIPFGTIAFSLVYYDARVRKEALDLELLMEQVAAPTNPAVSMAAAGNGLT